MRRRSYTLLEMTIAIGVLAVVSLFVVRLFALSSDLQRKSRDLDTACFGAQTMMEAARLEEAHMLDTLTGIWPGGVHSVEQANGAAAYEAYFDWDWRSVSVPDGQGYVFRMEINETAQWKECVFTARRLPGYLLEEPDTTGLLYTLRGGCYVPDEVGV